MPKLIATYRLQLTADFTLEDARQRVPYLHSLGVSHIYLSPVLTARPGSTHGYDVADPTHVSEALGGEDALRTLAADAHAKGMGILVDIVPNHMGIGPDNPFWDDVLQHGRASKFADWFDVSWRATTKRLAGKVLVPVLGDTLQHVIGRDEIGLGVGERGLRVSYFDHHFPLDPSTLPPELELAMRDPAAREIAAEWTTGVEGRSRLRTLLAKQHYELAFWRAASRDLNYRRFFDVNELISLKVEREDVFAATHRKVLELVADGVIDGLRVDHIDGLLEPRQYLERLRREVQVLRSAQDDKVSAVALRQPAEGPAPTQFPIYVEKILAHGETLPDDWPVDGTTGYEFLVTLEDAFIDAAGAEAIEARYRGAGEKRGFNRISVESKRRVLRSALNADVRRVAPMLATVAKRAGWPERSIAQYAGAIVEFIAALPVYRTYIDSRTTAATARDRAIIEQTLAHVRERTSADDGAQDALRCALLDAWAPADSPASSARLQFVLRLQQLSGPAAAKGVEDTALYAYAPLTSRCEVGSDPAVRVGGAVERLTERLVERAERFPHSLNATNTHDTKRSADARARIDALSEHANEWAALLNRWRRQHRELRSAIGSRLVPAAPAENFTYQSLLAVWPLTSATMRGDEWLDALRDRLTAYLQKASREAKVSTSWTDPDVRFEKALSDFVAGLLDRERSAAFQVDVARFIRRIAPQALWNSLGRLVMHLMSPGVPDIYQGDEVWYAALVDPDNRRPVDWPLREASLADAIGVAVGGRPGAQLAQWRDGMNASALKVYITHVLLALRADLGDLAGASFGMVEARGERAAHVMAFERRLPDGRDLLVAVARQTGKVDWPQCGPAWDGTSIPAVAGDYVQVVHGERVSTRNGVLSLSEVWPVLPVEVLIRQR